MRESASQQTVRASALRLARRARSNRYGRLAGGLAVVTGYFPMAEAEGCARLAVKRGSKRLSPSCAARRVLLREPDARRLRADEAAPSIRAALPDRVLMPVCRTGSRRQACLLAKSLPRHPVAERAFRVPARCHRLLMRRQPFAAPFLYVGAEVSPGEARGRPARDAKGGDQA